MSFAFLANYRRNRRTRRLGCSQSSAFLDNAVLSPIQLGISRIYTMLPAFQSEALGFVFVFVHPLPPCPTFAKASAASGISPRAPNDEPSLRHCAHPRPCQRPSKAASSAGLGLHTFLAKVDPWCLRLRGRHPFRPCLPPRRTWLW